MSYCMSNDATLIHLHLAVNLRGKYINSTPYINNAVSVIAVPPIPASTFKKESLGELVLYPESRPDDRMPAGRSEAGYWIELPAG
jgi:hypothetical protein